MWLAQLVLAKGLAAACGAARPLAARSSAPVLLEHARWFAKAVQLRQILQAHRRTSRGWETVKSLVLVRPWLEL